MRVCASGYRKVSVVHFKSVRKPQSVIAKKNGAYKNVVVSVRDFYFIPL